MLAILVLASCCLSKRKLPLQFGDVSESEIGVDYGGEFCQAFTLTNQQALTFFTWSTKVSMKRIHDEYNYLPCYVKGDLEYTCAELKYCEFEVRAVGTARVLPLKSEHSNNIFYMSHKKYLSLVNV